MAAATPDERFQRLREENERRRKKKEEEEKRRKQEEDQKAKEALERRRLERLEHDERMRKPWQQPPAPKKPILRKGAKQRPVQPGSPAVDPVRQSQAEEKRREQRQGLQAFIRQQRQVAAAAKTPKADGGPPVVPLTWEELRVAAEAGFDELLREQDLEAEQRAIEERPARGTRHRTPTRGPFRAPPAQLQEPVQIALVPVHNDTTAFTSEPASGPDPSGPSLPAPAAGAPGGAVGAGSVDPVASVQNSDKYSDAPPAAVSELQVWQQRGSSAPPAQIGGVIQGQATGGPSDGAVPVAVLNPPPSAEGSVGGCDSWAAGASGPMGDGMLNTAANSVASSGGLRRGVTAAARYRPLPLDAASLDAQQAAPGGERPLGHGVGPLSPRSSGGQRLPLPGPYDVPSQQQWAAPADPLDASLQAGGTLAALQGADGFRLGSPRLGGQQQQRQEQHVTLPNQHPSGLYAPSCPQQPQVQSQVQPAKAGSRPTRRGWALPPQAVAEQQASDDGRMDNAENVAQYGTRLGLAAAEPPPHHMAATTPDQPEENEAQARQSRHLDDPSLSSAAALPEPAPLRHSIGVGDSGGPEMWQRGSVMLAPSADNNGPGTSGNGDYSGTHVSSMGGTAAGSSERQLREETAQQTPIQLRAALAVDAMDDLVRFSSPAMDDFSGGQDAHVAAPVDFASSGSTHPPELGQPGPETFAGEAPGPSLQQPLGDVEELEHQRASGLDAAAAMTRGRQESAAVVDAAGEQVPLPASRPCTADGVSASGDQGTCVSAAGGRSSTPGEMWRSAAAEATGDLTRNSVAAPLELASGHEAPSSGTTRGSQQFSQQRSQLQEPALNGADVPHQDQQSLLPPIVPPRPPSGSSRLPPLPNGFQASAPPLPQIHAPGQAAPSSSGAPANAPANAMQSQQSVELPPAPQPQPPPIRAPSPPASPPRSVTTQRFHRQLSASAVPAANSATAASQVGNTPARPLSAELVSASASAAKSCQPPQASQPGPSPHPRVPPTAVLVPEPSAQAPTAATPISPRKPGVITMTPASPSRGAAPQPLQPPQPSSSAQMVVPPPLLAASSAKGYVQAAPPVLVVGSGNGTPSVIGTDRLAEPQRPGVPGDSGSAGSLRPATASSPSTRPTTASRPPRGYCLEAEPPTVAEEPSEEDVAAGRPRTAGDGAAGGGGQAAVGSRPGSSALGRLSPGRPPSAAEGSVISGSHISARPGSGSSLSGYGTRPGTGQGWGSGYQASLLDDSVSSFDFRLRSAAASRPASSACATPSPPHQLVMPYPPAAVSSYGTQGKISAVAPVSPVATPAPPAQHSLGQGPSEAGAQLSQSSARAHAAAHGSGPTASVALAGRSSQRSSANTAPHAFQVLQPPAAISDLYSAPDGGGDVQAFTEEAVQESGEHVPSQLPDNGLAPGPSAPDSASGEVPAGAPELDLDGLMREIQELSALRKALKAEFESMGRGEAAAALGTLSANFAPSGSQDVGEAGGAATREQHEIALPEVSQMAPTQQVTEASVAPAPLLQWGIPAAAGSAASATAAAASASSAAQGAQHMQRPQLPQALHDGVQLQWPTVSPLVAHPGAQQVPAVQPERVVIHAGPGAAGPGTSARPEAAGAAAALLPPAQVPSLPHAAARTVPALGHGQADSACEAVNEGQSNSFAFASPGPSGAPLVAVAGYAGTLLPTQGPAIGPLPIVPPVLPAPLPEASLPAAQAPSPPLAALQWTIPVNAADGTGGRSPANGPAPQRTPRTSGGVSGASAHGAAASAAGPTSASGCSTPSNAAPQPKRALSVGGYASHVAADSPVGGGTRGGGPQLSATNSSRGGASAAPATERPLINEGSYVQAALQARERAERERAAREALQAETAAAKAAALIRSKSDRAAMAAAAGAGAASPSAAAPGKQSAPLGPKAPSSIGSYVRQPAPARPAGRSGGGGADGTTSGAPSAAGTPASGGSTPDAPSTAHPAKPAWATPTSSRPSRIPTPPRAGPAATGAGAAGAAAQPPVPAASSTLQAPARQDSLGSDLDFLERASDVSDTETDSPSAYGIVADKSPPPQRAAPASGNAAAAAHPSSANRERLEGGRPRPLRIPASGAATPMGGASTASTVASRAVPTGNKRPSGGGAAGAGRGNGGKASTPFTAAIRELMGLPGSAPLEQARPVAAVAGGGRSSSGRAAEGPWPERLSAEEEQLLASLQRLDANILRKGLMAAGLINEPAVAAEQPSVTPPKAAAGSKGRAVGGAVAKAAGAARAGGPLTNSLQQDQLRESLEKLDVRLGALRKKVEDRAGVLGMPSAAAPAAAPGTGASGARTTRDPTPPKDERRGPPATLAKSRTPTPNKAKAIRDQRQQQLGGGQGATPAPARPSPAGPPKPASAPVVGASGAANHDAQLQQPHLQQHLGTLAAGGGATMSTAGQPQSMPPRAPAAKAPASAPSGPTTASNAAVHQHQQALAGAPYGVVPGPHGAMFPMPYGAMPMYGMPQAPFAADVQHCQQQSQAGQHPQPQQVAYVPALLPNGQVAYVPQYVSPGAAGGFPGFVQAPAQQPFMMMMGQGPQGLPQQAVLAGPGMALPQGGIMQPPQGGPMVAWAAGPQAAATQHPAPASANGVAPVPQQQHSSGGPSLYSFDRSGSSGHSASPAPYGATVQDTPGVHGSAAHQQPQSPSALPYTAAPPPTGPLPHYHSTVMRTRSFNSRDGEAAAAAAATGHHGHASHTAQAHAQGPEHHPSRQHSEGAPQPQPGHHEAQQPPRPHPVQFQSFGPKGGSRGVGTTAGWTSAGAGGNAADASTADGGIIKAVNLGLLL